MVIRAMGGMLPAAMELRFLRLACCRSACFPPPPLTVIVADLEADKEAADLHDVAALLTTPLV